MLMRLSDDEAINTDYIINLYLKKPLDKWLVVGKMIDGTLLILSEDTDKACVEQFYNTLINSHNERLKVLPAAY